MNLSSVLCISFAITQCLSGGTITSATAITESLLGGSCSQSSTGALVMCQTGTGMAEASASAGLGSLSVFAEGGAGGADFASGSASAEYDFAFLLPGVPSGAITGEYSISGEGLPPDEDVGVEFSIKQDNTLSPALNPVGFFNETVDVISPFTAGDMVEFSATAGTTDESPGFQSSTASLMLVGLFDVNGDPIAPGLGEVPEPNLLPVLGFSLVALYIWRRKCSAYCKTLGWSKNANSLAP
jgi:hypothetical protein